MGVVRLRIDELKIGLADGSQSRGTLLARQGGGWRQLAGKPTAVGDQVSDGAKAGRAGRTFESNDESAGGGFS